MSSLSSIISKPISIITSTITNPKPHPDSSIPSYTDKQTQSKITQSCRKKYPNMVPILVLLEPQPDNSSPFSSTHSATLKLTKNKFLISDNTTGLELQRHVLKHTEREINQALYFFVVDKARHRMLQNNVLVRDVYQMYRGEDGYLRVLVMRQNVF